MSVGENVGQVVDNAVAETERTAAEQIQRAKDDADAAARQAKQIADAALATELGGQIQATRQEFETWRTTADQRIMEMSETNRQSQERLAEATTLFGSIRALLTPTQEPPKPQMSKPEAGAAPTAENSTKTEPSEKPRGVEAETPAPAPQRRRHFL